MDDLLNELVKDWKREPHYKDVAAVLWEPGQPQLDKCPEGCSLLIYEQNPAKWGRVTDRDAYRQTRICRKHAFARIYVITGLTAAAFNWEPQGD
jgi:hypothetical protein